MRHVLLFSLLISGLADAAEKVKVGSSPVLSSAGIYLAQGLGYFKEAGLDVEIVDFTSSGAAMTLLLAKGDLDVGAGNLTSGLFNAITKGHDFKLVADKGHIEKGRDYIHFIVRKDHVDSGRYKSLKDLKGFKIGLTALDGVSQQIIAERILQKASLTEKDVEYVKMSYADMNVALKSKNLDAAIQLEPHLTKALIEQFAVSIMSGVAVHPKQQSAAVFYSPSFMKKKKEAVAFMKAYLRGIHAYNQVFLRKQNKPEVLAALKKIFKIDDDEMWKKMKPIGLYDNGQVDVPSLMEDIKWYRKKGYLEKDLKDSDIIDLSFVKEAASGS